MGALTDLYIKKETLKTILKVLESKEGKESNGIQLTISIGDDTNTYGQNVSATISQSKEQRDAGKPKFYVGNGKVFWTDGTIKKAEQSDVQNQSSDNGDDDDLPF